MQAQQLEEQRQQFKLKTQNLLKFSEEVVESKPSRAGQGRKKKDKSGDIYSEGEGDGENQPSAKKKRRGRKRAAGGDKEGEGRKRKRQKREEEGGKKERKRRYVATWKSELCITSKCYWSGKLIVHVYKC